eukprot:4414231-Pyramimonas_sp.AAC.1
MQPSMELISSSGTETEMEEPTTGTPTPTSAKPVPSRLSSEVIRKLTDTEVQQIIENERQAIRSEEHAKLAKEIIQKGLIDTPGFSDKSNVGRNLFKVEEETVEKPRASKRFG